MEFFTSPVFWVYFAAVSVASAFITAADKYFAKKNKWRIPEKTLLLLAFVGGALPMLVTMKLIRHKTKHKKFMLGLPVMVLLHIAIVVAIIWIF